MEGSRELSGPSGTSLGAQRNSSYILTKLFLQLQQSVLNSLSLYIRAFMMVKVCLYKLHIWLAPSRDSVRFGDKSLRENRFAPPLHATTEEISFVIVVCFLPFVGGFMNSRKSSLEWRRYISRRIYWGICCF